MAIKAMVSGKEVQVGDGVGFKSDIEQYGIIIDIIQRDRWSPVMLVVKPAGEHFEGEYLRNLTRAELAADDCWLD